MRPNKSISKPGILVAGVLLLLFTLTLIASSQEKKYVPLPDTAMENVGKMPRSFPTELAFDRLTFLLPRSPDFFAQQPILQSQFLFRPVKGNIDLESYWKMDLAKQNEYKTLRTILGTVQLGGVAYIAYQHVKKYGWK